MRNEHPILTHSEGRVAVFTINRPDRMNALDDEANRMLNDALRSFRDNDECWVGIITGTGGRAFCAGGDLSDEDSGLGKGSASGRVSFGGGLTGIAGRRFETGKPLIAAVDGYALGGGFELAMSCDVIIASQCSSFGLPEVRVGWISDSPCVHRAIRHLPYHVGMGLILTGQRISAQLALQFGLVNELVESSGVMEAALRWAETICACSPLAVRAVREAAIEGLDRSLDAALGARWESIENFQLSKDRLEGPAAFREKRKPIWRAE